MKFFALAATAALVSTSASAFQGPELANYPTGVEAGDMDGDGLEAIRLDGDIFWVNGDLYAVTTGGYTVPFPQDEEFLDETDAIWTYCGEQYTVGCVEGFGKLQDALRLHIAAVNAGDVISEIFSAPVIAAAD